MHAYAAWSEERAAEIIRTHVSAPGAALPILHALQEAFGFIPDAVVPLLANALNISRAEVHGIVSFYHDFRDAPPGRHVMKLCRAEACQSRGGEKIAQEMRQKLGIGWGETTADGAVTLEPIYCLGFCAVAPAAQWDGQPLGRVTTERLTQLVSEASS